MIMETLKDKDLISIQETRDLIEKAYEAQKEFAALNQEETNIVVDSLAKVLRDNSEYLGKLASDTTGFGKWEDKKIKNIIASEILNDYMRSFKTRGIINVDEVNKIYEMAVPVGVIAGIVPTTNPTATIMYKSLISLKSGNAIVFSPHPRALKCILKTVDIIKEELKKIGQNPNLVGCISTPTMGATNELMKHPKVSLILATGGSAMVKSAYSSGKPAFGVGPGNVPSYIDRSADIEQAVFDILSSKTFDNGTICASEQAVLAHTEVLEQINKEFVKQGGYFLNAEESKKVEKILISSNGNFNPQIVGLSAVTLANMAGIVVPSDTRVLIAKTNGVGKDYPFSIEKLTCILAFYEVHNLEEAKNVALDLLHFGGMGHTCAIHAKDEETILSYASVMPVSRLLVNTPTTQGAVGYSTNLAPSMTLGCGTFGGNITSDNITALHLFNRARIAYGIKGLNTVSCNSKINNIDEELINKIVQEVKKIIG